MKTTEQRAAANKFVKKWSGKGYEKGECQKFWLDLLVSVFGIQDFVSFVQFENQIKERFADKTITNFIDVYIPSTKVMVEQKSVGKDLRAPIRQSDGSLLTPFQQARKYISGLPLSQHPRWVITCNFDEFLIYDMEKPGGEPEQVFLKDLPKEIYRLHFLVDSRSDRIRREEEISLKAGELVGKLYDALYKQYIAPDEKSLRSLNILCVRIVFCLYAEDAGLFDTKTAFEEYIQSFKIENVRRGLIDLFKALDTKTEDRDKYDTKLSPFPYVNGGLFAHEDIEIPNFNEEIVDVIVNHCAPFDWSEISPTIFGAVFESTLNPETRRQGGMHYTSIENIHKVIDPLFLDELKGEFSCICETKNVKSRNEKLESFQKKIGSLKFLDPACGSGNFLTETYASLRKLENECIKLRLGKESALDVFGDEFKPQVNIDQFYGIEINDFAVTVAKTALWIAECQMMEETSRILNRNLEFLPLKSHAAIVEGNALRMDWEYLSEEPHLDLLYADKLKYYIVPEDFDKNALHDVSVKYETSNTLHVATKQVEQGKLEPHKVEKIRYDYIMGNPPFLGYSLQTKEQKEETQSIYVDEKGKPYRTAGKIDYVANWYFRASELIQGTKTKCAFVSTNSITQGEQVAGVWKPLFERFNLQIDFAYRTFRWDSESEQKAHVHCVIIGFSAVTLERAPGAIGTTKRIFLPDGKAISAQNINAYLMDAPNVFVESRKHPLCKVPLMTTGNRPADGGHLIIEADEYENFIRKEPEAKRFIKRLVGSEEFINNKPRYCLWLVDATPAQIKGMHEVYKRVQACKLDRESSPDEGRQKLALRPALFRETNNPESYIVVPKVSSEKRNFIPMGFFDGATISTDLNFIIPDATLYHFGILTSSVHMAWMRAVCGRLKSDYRYSKDIVYNNFPFVLPRDSSVAQLPQDDKKGCHSDPCRGKDFLHCTAAQASKIEKTAQAILDVRAKYPDSSLADLYDELTMPADLRRAHAENDRAVMEAYSFAPKMTEDEIVAELFKMYGELTK